jgi:hypothetical protein
MGKRMILLVTANARASECAEAIGADTGEEILMAESLVRATSLLRGGTFQAAVFDQHLLESDPDEAGNTLEHLDTAMLVQVNLAVSGMNRLLREVRVALQRRQREERSARRAALNQLQSELNGTITALLLSSELALNTPDLPAGAAQKLESVVALVRKVRQQLEAATAGETTLTEAMAELPRV